MDTKLKPKQWKLSDEDQLNIIKQYKDDKLTSVEIAKIYNVSKKAILDVLTKHNIERRSMSHSHQKYAINENYFDEINSHEKAYFLGFIAGDGCNHTSRNALQILIQYRDKHILESFVKSLNSNHPISFRHRREPHHQDYCLLHISNKQLSESLSKYGIIQNKTYVLNFPNIPFEYYNSFILGLFDSDGCFTSGYYGRKIKYFRGHFSIVGTVFILDKVNEIFSQFREGKKYKLIKCPRHYDNYRILNINNDRVLLELYNFLYKDSPYFLIRKHNAIKTYLEFKNLI